MDAQQQQREASPRPPHPAAGGGGDFTTTHYSIVLCRYFLHGILPTVSTSKQSLAILHQVPEGHVGVYWRGGAPLSTITDPVLLLCLLYTLLLMFTTSWILLVEAQLQTDLVRDIPCGTKGGVLINFEKIVVNLSELPTSVVTSVFANLIMLMTKLFILISIAYLQVVNRLHKDYVHETLCDYGIKYDNMWIYDKIHHEINQFCSALSLQQVHIDMFDQIGEKMKDALRADCTRYAPGIEILSVRITKPTIPHSIMRNFEQMEEERTKAFL